ncbi:MAG: acyl-protein synthase [Bacteriovoracaceae bacterium]|nr:acyl-protein synthase [Bacteriovoracaceae bacterium]
MTTNESPKVIDPIRLKHVQSFCDIHNPYQEIDASLFIEAMKEVCLWHMENSPFYRSLCSQENFSPDVLKTTKDLERIPTVLAHFFKEHEVLSVPEKAVALHLTSSGTTGQKSQVFFDDWSIRAPQGMLDRIFEAYGWVTPKQNTNYLLYTYETEAGSKLGTAYTDHYLCKYAPANQVTIALKMQGDGSHGFDFPGVMSALQRFEKEGLPVRIFGFPAFLAETLERMENLGLAPLKLHPDSLVFLGGGWKGKASKAIPKSELYEKTTRLLGIPDHRLRDGFGSVEHCIPYVECDHHEFHIPIWSKVIIRDVKNLKPIGLNEIGFLSFLSPYMTSMPAHAVVMGDLASLHESCPCGNTQPFFRLKGRAGTTQNKSCAIAAAEILGKNS